MTKQYYEKHKAKISEKRKKKYAENKETILAKRRSEYDVLAKSEYNKQWYKKNVGKRKEYAKTEARKAYQVNYRKTEARKIAVTSFNSKPERKEYMKNYVAKRRKIDPEFLLKDRLNRRLHHALVDNVKKERTLKYVGCTISFLKQHLENLFAPGMSWENYGSWHVDHKKPCAMFDHSREAEIKECWNYTNLQPMWAAENIKKNSYHEGKRILKP